MENDYPNRLLAVTRRTSACRRFDSFPQQVKDAVLVAILVIISCLITLIVTGCVTESHSYLKLP